MKKAWMKYIALFLLLGTTIPATAQHPQRSQEEKKMREIPSPQKNARNIIREFKKEFCLTEKEYDKVYDLYLKHENDMTPEEAGAGGMPPRGRMGRPPGGFGGPGMDGGMPRLGDGMPPQGGFPPAMGEGMPEDAKVMMERIRAEQEQRIIKAGKKLEKKMKKILKGQEFSRWKQWETNRKRFQIVPGMPPR